MDTEKLDIRLIALDLDGTTLDDRSRLTEENKEALEEAAAKGIIIAVASGRVLSSLPEEVTGIRGLKYAITSNGARVTDVGAGRNVYSNCIEPHVIRDVIRLAEENDLRLEAFWNDRAYIDAKSYREIDERGCDYRRREYVLRTRTPVEDIYDRMLDNDSIIENINIFFDDPAYADVLRPLAEKIGDATITSSLRNNIEVGGKTTSKMDAIRFIAEKHGIGRANIMCFGDAPNDIAMIEYAGFGVAMGNAWGGTKEKADYVAETNSESGVAKTIRRFVL